MKPQYMSQILKEHSRQMTEDYMKKHARLQNFMKVKIHEAYASALEHAKNLMMVCEQETEDKLKDNK